MKIAELDGLNSQVIDILYGEGSQAERQERIANILLDTYAQLQNAGALDENVLKILLDSSLFADGARHELEKMGIPHNEAMLLCQMVGRDRSLREMMDIAQTKREVYSHIPPLTLWQRPQNDEGRCWQYGAGGPGEKLNYQGPKSTEW